MHVSRDAHRPAPVDTPPAIAAFLQDAKAGGCAGWRSRG